MLPVQAAPSSVQSLATPMSPPRKLLKCAASSEVVFTANATFSLLITFSVMTVPCTPDPPSPLLILIPAVPGVAESATSEPLPLMVLAMIMFPYMLSAGAPLAGPLCECSATPGRLLFVSVFPTMELLVTFPGPSPSENRPTPAPPPDKPFLFETLFQIVLLSTPWWAAYLGGVEPTGGCDARTMPHSRALLETPFFTMTLLWLSAVSSVIKIPSALPVTVLFDTSVFTAPIRCNPPPQSPPSSVS